MSADLDHGNGTWPTLAGADPVRSVSVVNLDDSQDSTTAPPSNGSSANADPFSDPWRVLVVEHENDAATLAKPYADAGVTVVSVADPGLGDVVRGVSVLLMDRAQRHAGDVAALGAVEVLGAWTPPPFRGFGEYAEDAIRRAGASTNAELVELCRAVTDRARFVRGARTGHPAFDVRPERPWRRQRLGDVLATPPQPWLIRGWLRAGNVAMVGAFSTVGKSTMVAGWCASLATGTPWCGCRAAAGSVLALVGEGRRGFALRVEAAIAATGQQMAAGCVVEIVDFREPLSSPSGQRAFRELLAEFVAEHGHAPALVAIDTVSSHWAESEDASEFAAPFVRTLADVAAEHGCAVVGVHHTTKAKDRNTMPTLADFRGSGAFVCNVDVAVAMCCDGPDAVRVESIKTKDDEIPAPLRLVRGVAAMGEDAEGEPVTAALLLPSGVPAGPQADPAQVERDRRTRKHRDNVDAVCAALERLGSATKVDAIVKEAGLRLVDGRAACAAALSLGRIISTGSARRPNYVPRGGGGGGAHPTPLGTTGTLRVPPSGGVRDAGDDSDDKRGQSAGSAA